MAGKASGSPALLTVHPKELRGGSSRRPSGWFELQEETLKTGRSTQGPSNMERTLKATMYGHDLQTVIAHQHGGDGKGTGEFGPSSWV